MTTQTKGDTGNFDLTQTAFLFSWISNFSATASGTEQELADLVYSALADPNNPDALLVQYKNDLIGKDWELKWGPGVFEIKPGPKGKADNTAYVVYSASQKTYIVAIAGTNPKALRDWMFEDFDLRMVDWVGFDPMGLEPQPNGNNPLKQQITRGTALGVWALASQLIHSHSSPSNKSLGQFLLDITGDSDTQVIFTGHSLGGALSPTLAHWFRHANNNIENKNVSAIPVAGPTPGNALYQGLWDWDFPRRGRTVNTGNQVDALNQNVRCLEDVVPHGWQYIFYPSIESNVYYFSNPAEAAEQDTTPEGLYSNMGTLVPGKDMRDLVTTLQVDSTAKTLTQTIKPINFQADFPVQYIDSNGDVDTISPLGEVPLADFLKYMGALGEVHVWSYGPDAFNIDFSVFQNLRLKL